MNDSRIQHCLDLCARASHLSGDDLSHTLLALHEELQSLLNDGPGSALRGALPDPDAKWKHEPIITMDMAG